MPSNFIPPFDFKTVYLNYFLGSQELFSIAMVLLLSFLSAYFGMSNKVFLVVLAISLLIMGAYIGASFYILVLFMVGFFTYKAFTRILQ
jgi:hypothetical protein